MQPYEKFMKLGPDALTDEELLAIVIRTGTKDIPCLKVSELVLGKTKGRGLLGLHHFSMKELMSIPGIGEVKAVKLKCVAALAERLSRMSALDNLKFLNPKSVADYYMERLRHKEQECVMLLLLNQKLRLISEKILTIGTVSASVASPREVFLEALKEGAVQIMLLHNHPSGDPTPSSADLQVTKRIQETGKILDIPLIDHIIIGDNRYYSMKESGYL